MSGNEQQTNFKDAQYYQAYHDIFKLGSIAAKMLCDKCDIKYPGVMIDALARGALVVAVSKDPYLVEEANENDKVNQAIKIITTNENNAAKAFGESFKCEFNKNPD